ETLLTMTEILHEVLPENRIVALSGPTHAEEVALDMPTTIVSACEDMAAAEEVRRLFDGSCIRAYVNEDVKGVELSGALKNVIALASGIAVGAGFGDNTKAAIITRGLAEIKRLGVAMGCREETFSGLAGIGDLVVTATSMHSRNNKCGMLIGQGVPAEEAVTQVGMVVEGLNALDPALSLAGKYVVEMPVARR
ncbi:MAG: NAD(P)H-dependent glycerol-3-phosphate dehydrogenase, partial [Lachnospiraceae bacterium]|nr:NAD(P)H-dependent glycerol-3-phosphate dehydrogenase [Candidatus Hippenecus merdae]